MNSLDILNIISEDDKGVEISFFTEILSPLVLAEQLKKLIDIVDIDWEVGLISKKKVNSTTKDLFEIKDSLIEKRKTPDYMKIEKTEKNKPYITKKGR